jgi:hypothetical protein
MVWRRITMVVVSIRECCSQFSLEVPVERKTPSVLSGKSLHHRNVEKCGRDHEISCFKGCDRLCSLVVRVSGYRSGDQDSIPGATGFSK